MGLLCSYLRYLLSALSTYECFDPIFRVKERASGLQNLLHIFPKFSSVDPAQSGVRMPVRREEIEEKKVL